jgi:hypothetical protein
MQRRCFAEMRGASTLRRDRLDTAAPRADVQHPVLVLS